MGVDLALPGFLTILPVGLLASVAACLNSVAGEAEVELRSDLQNSRVEVEEKREHHKHKHSLGHHHHHHSHKKSSTTKQAKIPTPAHSLIETLQLDQGTDEFADPTE